MIGFGITGKLGATGPFPIAKTLLKQRLNPGALGHSRDHDLRKSALVVTKFRCVVRGLERGIRVWRPGGSECKWEGSASGGLELCSCRLPSWAACRPRRRRNLLLQERSRHRRR